MRYLGIKDAHSALRGGRSVEQLLAGREEDGSRIVRFIRLDREPYGKFSATLFEVIDEGREDFSDVYEFSALDPDFPHGITRSFESADEAMGFALSTFGANTERFVNAGIVQDEYADAYFQK